MYASGIGKSQIARILNAEGIPNPTEYKRQQGIRWHRQTDTERSSLWQYFSIADILNNEVYIGHMVQGKYASVSYKTHQNKPQPKENWIRVENTHAPIIEKELWDKVQDIINSRAKSGWNGQIGMFARKAKCLYCGYTMASSKSNGRHYLQCSSRRIKADACTGGFIGQKELEDTVLTELHDMIEKYLDMDSAEEQIQLQDEKKRQMDGLRKELQQMESKLGNLDKTLKLLYEDRAQGILSPEEYVRLSETFRKDAITYEGMINTLKEKIAVFEAEKDEKRNKRELLEQFANIKKLNYDIVNTLIDYIEVGRREGHYRNGKVPVVIHWRF